MSVAGFLYFDLSLPASELAAWVVKSAKGLFAASLVFGGNCYQKPLLGWARSLNGLCLSWLIAEGSSKADSLTEEGPRAASSMCVKEATSFVFVG